RDACVATVQDFRAVLGLAVHGPCVIAVACPEVANMHDAGEFVDGDLAHPSSVEFVHNVLNHALKGHRSPPPILTAMFVFSLKSLMYDFTIQRNTTDTGTSSARARSSSASLAARGRWKLTPTLPPGAVRRI